MKTKNMVKSLETDSLSRYKTLHNFENYGEINSLDDYAFFIEWARKNNKGIFIVGNGSNTLFIRRNVKSLVLKNKIPAEIECISEGNNLFRATSNVMILDVLNFCYKKSLDSFYYLASVPATIGGAIAMNAGEGKHINKSICDFVDSVTYLDSDGLIKTVKHQDMDVAHRKTIFTGQQDKFIVSVIFKFPKTELGEVNPIKKRIEWAKEIQDNTAPNCGSVFNQLNGRILNVLKGFKIGGAQYSKKSSNWINNNSKSVLPILSLIRITQLIHFVLHQKCKVEVIQVK